MDNSPTEEHTQITLAEGIPDKEFDFEDTSDLGHTATSTELEMTELISEPIYTEKESPELSLQSSQQIDVDYGHMPEELDEEKGEYKTLVDRLRELAKIKNRGVEDYWGKIKIYKKNPHISLGPDYIFTIILYTFIILISILLLRMFWGFSQYLCFFCALAVDALLLFFLSMTVFSNPGIPSFKIDEEDIDNIRRNQNYWCSDCKIVRKSGMCHCDDCDACISEYDHHCPWMGKCIGKGNIIWFYCFIGGFFFFMLANAGLSIAAIAFDEEAQKALAKGLGL